MKRTMKILLLFATFLCAADAFAQGDSLLVVSWNVENFLNPRTDTTGRHTASRLRNKCNAISKTLLLIAGQYGRLPDAVALMEVGDRYVLERLLNYTPLRKLDYAIVHFDSPDRRGIDCALLYRRSTLKLVSASPKHLYDSNGAVMRTRDILLAEFDALDILVNHHPSKVGISSEGRRAVAMDRLRWLMDSLAAVPSKNSPVFLDGRPQIAQPSKKTPYFLDGSAVTGSERRILAVGDFNDDLWKDGSPGTIKYNGAWEKIDGFFARGPISVRESVFNHPLLSEEDKKYGGTKPRRSFSGPRYLGGVSDHYPLVLRIMIADATSNPRSSAAAPVGH